MQIFRIIKDYLQAILVFFVALFALLYYRSEASKLKKQAKQEQQKSKNYQSQIDTYIEQQKAESDAIENAKTNSSIKRDYFE